MTIVNPPTDADHQQPDQYGRIPHKCTHAWCTTEWHFVDSPPDHYQGMSYVIPTTYPRLCPAIGVSLTFDEGEQTAPWISVHLLGDDGTDHENAPNIDVDTHLTIEEAIEMRDLLDVAISHGLGYEPAIDESQVR